MRPLLTAEARSGHVEAWHTDGASLRLDRDRLVSGGRGEWLADATHSFDHVFGPEADARAVYDAAAARLVPGVVGGTSCTLIAYGQTSSGKTTTMLGLAGLAFEDAFARVALAARESPARAFSLRASCIEVYNEQCHDLLTGRTGLRLFDRRAASGAAERASATHCGEVIVEDLSSWAVASADEALELLHAAESRRAVGSTAANDRSSRSHLVYSLRVESWPADGTEGVVRAASLQLVDLAGSERAHTHAAESLGAEGAHINKSLLTLGLVVSRLADASSSSGRGGPCHVPYRDSKLTRLLQSSLSGGSTTAIICTISPATGAVEESLNTVCHTPPVPPIPPHTRGDAPRDAVCLSRHVAPRSSASPRGRAACALWRRAPTRSALTRASSCRGYSPS